MSLIFWDSMIFVYLMEDHQNSLRVSGSFGNRCLNGETDLHWSSNSWRNTGLAVREPGRNLVARYKALLSPPVVEVLDFTSKRPTTMRESERIVASLAVTPCNWRAPRPQM